VTLNPAPVTLICDTVIAAPPSGAVLVMVRLLLFVLPTEILPKDTAKVLNCKLACAGTDPIFTPQPQSAMQMARPAAKAVLLRGIESSIQNTITETRPELQSSQSQCQDCTGSTTLVIAVG